MIARRRLAPIAALAGSVRVRTGAAQYRNARGLRAGKWHVAVWDSTLHRATVVRPVAID